MRRTFALCAGLVVILSAAACTKQVEAPSDVGVCWHMVAPKPGQYRFNRLADHQPNIETCAASLEAMRLRFMSLGSQNRDIVGSYQGQFIFLQPEGVFVGQTLTGARYLLLVPTGDGRLAMPGAVQR